MVFNALFSIPNLVLIIFVKLNIRNQINWWHSCSTEDEPFRYFCSYDHLTSTTRYFSGYINNALISINNLPDSPVISSPRYCCSPEDQESPNGFSCPIALPSGQNWHFQQPEKHLSNIISLFVLCSSFLLSVINIKAIGSCNVLLKYQQTHIVYSF